VWLDDETGVGGGVESADDSPLIERIKVSEADRDRSPESFGRRSPVLLAPGSGVEAVKVLDVHREDSSSSPSVQSTCPFLLAAGVTWTDQALRASYASVGRPTSRPVATAALV